MSSCAIPASLGLVSALLFFLTAAVGVWAAYDRPVAQARFGLITTGLLLALGLAWFGRGKSEAVFLVIGFASCLGIVGLALAFVMLPHIPSGPIANSLIILFPFALPAAAWTWNRRCWLSACLVGASLLIGFTGLGLARERTAWLALSAGLAAMGVIHWQFAGKQGRLFHCLLKGVLATAGGCLIVYIALVISPTSEAFQRIVPLGPLTGRLPLWHDSLALIQDYFFTGSGLGCTTMGFSSYVFLLHVPFEDQAHNLFLQIAIEQGVPGLIAFLGMAVAASWSLVVAFRARKASSHLSAMAATAALVGLLVYGMFDSEAYVSPLIPVLFFPLGCAWALGSAGFRGSLSPARFDRSVWSKVVRSAMIVGVAVPILLFFQGSRAQYLADLGAVSQSRTELSVYKWPRWGLQDELRRSQVVDLSGAIHAYRSALDFDPFNVTANRRLGQIELAQGNYPLARQHLEKAFAIAPDQRATRQLLGEVYAIAGNYGRAINLWQSIDTSHGQLEVRRWWYENIGARQELDRLTRAITLLREGDREFTSAGKIKRP